MVFCFVFSCCAVHFGKELLISCVCVCVCACACVSCGSHQPNLGILLTLSHCKLIACSHQSRYNCHGVRAHSYSLSKAPRPGSPPKGGRRKSELKNPHAGTGAPLGCWRAPRFKAELVFVVSRERIAVGRIGFLYAFELGKLQNRLNSLMQMPFGFVMGSLLRARELAVLETHHGLPRGTSGQRESTLKCQEAGNCLSDSKTNLHLHMLRDLQKGVVPHTAWSSAGHTAGWAALPLAVRMPPCSSPPCAPDMKRRQDLSSPSEKWVQYMCVGPSLIFPVSLWRVMLVTSLPWRFGSNGATMASPFFPEFPGSEHWPGVGRDTLLMCDIAPQNVAVNCACQPSEPVGADF